MIDAIGASPLPWLREVAGDAQLSPTVKATALVFGALADPAGRPFSLSADAASKSSRLGMRSTRAAISELRTASYLVEISRGGWRGASARASQWILCMPGDRPPVLDGGGHGVPDGSSRDALHVAAIRAEGENLWKIRLSCGHDAYRTRTTRKRPPAAAWCYECEGGS